MPSSGLYLDGERVRRARIRKLMTTQQLADVLGVSYRHIHRAQTNRDRVSLDLLGRIATALDVPIAQIVNEGDRDIFTEQPAEVA
jgi:UDP-N-acetylglucosamine 1-carboxyvinyltransferase